MAGEGKTELETKELKIVPRIIKGLNKHVTSEESWGGNAGKNSAAANAFFDDKRQEFVFTNYPEKSGRDFEVTFRVAMAPLTKEALKSKPPVLIRDVFPSNVSDQRAAMFRERAIAHNAWEIEVFLKGGGNIKLLPKTALVPESYQKDLAP